MEIILKFDEDYLKVEYFSKITNQMLIVPFKIIDEQYGNNQNLMKYI